jgi:hypothetical protein
MCSMSMYKRTFYTYMIDQQMQIHKYVQSHIILLWPSSRRLITREYNPYTNNCTKLYDKTKQLEYRTDHITTIYTAAHTQSTNNNYNLYIPLFWNRWSYRFLYTTKQATELTNPQCQNSMFQSKECCICIYNAKL